MEFSLGGLDVGVKDGRDFVEVEDLEVGITFSVAVVMRLFAPISVDFFVVAGSGMAEVATSLLFKLRFWSFEETSSPPAAMSREEAINITSKANISNKGSKFTASSGPQIPCTCLNTEMVDIRPTS